MRRSIRLALAAAALVAANGGLTHTANAAGILSQTGGVCLDAEGGVRDGARLIGYPCHGGANQEFAFVNAPDTRLQSVGTDLCATSDSTSQGSEIRLRPCDWSTAGNALQNFSPWDNAAIGHNSGFVMDLAGGWGGQLLTLFPGVLQPVVLWSSHGGDNQRWYAAYPNAYPSLANTPDGSYIAIPGLKGLFRKDCGAITDITSGALINLDGGTLISDRGQGIIAAGGLN